MIVKWLESQLWWFRILILVFLLISALLLVPVIGEKIIVTKMATDLSKKYGNDYGILRLHMGGEPVVEPCGFTFVKLLYEYNFTDDYKPQGSGGFTGKSCYLLMLITDNTKITDCYWSFREFRLVFSVSDLPCDYIKNLTESTAQLYSYGETTRTKRLGMMFCDKKLNDPRLTVYYRPVKQGYSKNAPDGNCPDCGNAQNDNWLPHYEK